MLITVEAIRARGPTSPPPARPRALEAGRILEFSPMEIEKPGTAPFNWWALAISIRAVYRYLDGRSGQGYGARVPLPNVAPSRRSAVNITASTSKKC